MCLNSGSSVGAISGRTSASVRDRKSTRLNSSHGYISYADFCLKKKNAAPLAALLDRLGRAVEDLHERARAQHHAARLPDPTQARADLRERVPLSADRTRDLRPS